MSKETFEFLSIIMRYWFLFLILLILFNVVKNAWEEYLFTRKNVESNVVHKYWLKMLECPDKRVISNMVGLRYSNTVGCSKMCDIFLPFKGISKNHCIIRYKGDAFYVKDTKSQYGTFVNGEEIKRKRVLENGDVITLGTCSVQLVIEEGDR